jgi:hypothetical protein
MRMFAALLACCLGGVPAGTGSQQWCNLSCPCPLITRCPLVCGLYVHACVCVCVFVCVCVRSRSKMLLRLPAVLFVMGTCKREDCLPLSQR